MSKCDMNDILGQCGGRSVIYLCEMSLHSTNIVMIATEKIVWTINLPRKLHKWLNLVAESN